MEGGRYATLLDPHSPQEVHDHLARGRVGDRDGLIFFDSFHHPDGDHAARAAALSRAVLVEVPHAGHPVTPVLHEVFPLREILRLVVTGNLDIGALRRDVLKAISAHPVYLAARPGLFDQFLLLSEGAPDRVSVQSLCNAAKTLDLYRDHWPDAGFRTQVARTQALLDRFAPHWPKVWARCKNETLNPRASRRGMKGAPRSARPSLRRPGSPPPP